MMKAGWMNIRRGSGMTALIAAAALFCPAAPGVSQEQYKEHARDAIALIAEDRVEDAVRRLESYLEKHPGDLESLFGLAAAHAKANDLDKALVFTRKALGAGLPFARFQAGPRSLLAPLLEDPRFKELAGKNPLELLHGPLLGCVTGHSAKCWVRTASEAPVRIRARPAGAEAPEISSAVVRTDCSADFTAVLALDGLEPDTGYQYEVLVNGRREAGPFAFRTFPSWNAPARFRIGFGGGAGYTPEHERQWRTIAARNPLAFLFLGDNVYIDHPTLPAVQRYCYYRRQSRPEYRALCAGTAIHAIWDDHDFITNDAYGGSELEKPSWKIPVWRIFRDNWNNPSYGGGEEQPGCWFDFSIGDVDFILLDGRYYRTNPRNENPSMLGPVQKAWLFRKLKASGATFIVLASPVPWSNGTKPGSLDTWEGYKEEREEIFSFLDKHRIKGVILLSADRHRSDVWKIERSEGYDLYEFESSRLTNIHRHGIRPGALFGYNEKCSFGLLDFDTTKADPEVTYRIIDIDGEVVHTFTVRKSQLE